MNQLHVIRFSFQCIFVINCIVLYGFLMRNNLEQAIAIRARTSKMAENTCYSSNKSKTNNKIDDILLMVSYYFISLCNCVNSAMFLYYISVIV